MHQDAPEERLTDKIIKILENISFSGIILTAFFLPITIAGTNIGVGICIVFYLLKKVVSKKFFPDNPSAVNVFILLFSIAALLSLLNAKDTRTSLIGVQKILKLFFIFFAVSETVNTGKRLKILIWAIAAGALLVSLDGLVQFSLGMDFIRGKPIEIGTPLEGLGGNFKRINASFHNSQDLATYLATVVPLLLSLGRYGVYARREKFLLFVTLGLAMFCLIFTYSRGAAVALLVTSALFLVLKRDKLILVIILLLLFSAPVIISSTPLQWAVSRPSFIAFFYDSSRLQHWQTAINMIKAHPYIGIGTNSFCRS